MPKKPKQKPPKKSKDDVMREWMYGINSWNAGELARSFEDWLGKHGYYITEKKGSEQ